MLSETGLLSRPLFWGHGPAVQPLRTTSPGPARYEPVSRSWLSSLAELRAYDVQVSLWERRICGIEYLGHVTLLLQRARLASPVGGLWEAADFQWWWRRDQHDDPEHQVFWVDDDHAAAAVVLTNWGGRYGCDLLAADHNLCAVLPIVWPVACTAIDSVGDDPVEMMIRDDDAALIDAATTSGFSVTNDVSVATWMPAAGRPLVSTIAEGFALTDRSMLPVWPHHLARRNGDQVAERLAECSLYRPDLDIAVYAPDGEVAAYGVFWADLVTGVGLVEPMRTEDRYQGMGLGRHVLTTGLNRLAALGCQRFKVSYVTGNDASRRLYLGVGFRPESTSRTYRTS